MLRPLMLLFVAIACAPAEVGEGRLELLGFRQAGRTGVFLNESLDFHFSAELDEASVTSEAFRIHDGQGGLVRGRTVVQGKKLVFYPLLPLDPGLESGSFEPAREYTVELMGFPRPDGIRGLGGEILARPHRGSFRTVTRAEGMRYFLDPTPDLLQVPLDIAPGGRRIGPLGALRFRTHAPLDPTTLTPGDFRLVRFIRREGEVEHEPVEVRVELTQNAADGATIELRPAGRDDDLVPAFEPGDYYVLPPDGPVRLRALGGQPVIRPSLPIEVFVAGPEIETHREEFETTRGRSREAVRGADGTALWSGDGSVRMRFPNAAGDGRDGEWELAGDLARGDLNATRIRVPAGARCDLPSEGLCLLRSQTSIRIDGHLRRRVESGENRWKDGEFHDDWRARTRNARPAGWAIPSMRSHFRTDEGARPPRSEWQELSEFLAEAQAADRGWTVLVAGGDLVIEGTLETDGPLLLVAGGTIRIAGRIFARESWRPIGVSETPLRRSEAAPLLIDEPESANPLIVRLVQTVLSEPIRPPRGVQRWRAAQRSSEARGGRATIRFRGQRKAESVADAATLTFGPVDDVALLDDCEAVSFLVELEYGPSDSWDPPVAHWVELSWYEASQGP